MFSRAMRLLRTTAFRYAVAYATLFSVSVVALGAYAYQSSFGAVAREADRALSAEIESFRSVYETQRLIGLRNAVRARSVGLEDEFYLLVAPNGRVIAGNLSSVPPSAVGADGAFEFNYETVLARKDSEPLIERRRARGVWARFPDAQPFEPAAALLIARDIAEREALRERLQTTLFYGGGATIVLGLVIGAVFGALLLRRVDAINHTAARIRAGDLTSRIDSAGSGDELDRLADNLNAMLDQIERLMTGMRQVSDNVAHDLRSPLTRIRARLEAALASPEADLEEVSAETIEDVDRMLSVFNALLAIARIESGEGLRDMEDVDVGVAIEELVELYEPAAREAGFALTSSAEKGLVARTSRTLLSQALANLVDNALKYAEGGERIEVSARRHEKGGVFVSVADDGAGVREADRERIFQRFVRLETSRTSPGSGLGLSLVSAIARASGARIVVEDGVGEGDRPGVRIGLAFP